MSTCNKKSFKLHAESGLSHAMFAADVGSCSEQESDKQKVTSRFAAKHDSRLADMRAGFGRCVVR